MGLIDLSPDFFDRIINVRFMGDVIKTKMKALEAAIPMSKEEFEAASITYQQPGSGTVIVKTPKIASSEGKDGPYMVSEIPEAIQLQRVFGQLTCDSGIKPSISVSFKMLPGLLVYHVILKITNLNLPFDIRQCSMIRVTAGYRDASLQQTFNIGVFASYIESPGPDDITVFEGMIVDSFDSFFSERTFIVKLEPHTSVAGLIDAFSRYMPGQTTFDASSLGTVQAVKKTDVDFKTNIRQEVLDLEISVTGSTLTYHSGYQAVNDLVRMIQDTAKNLADSNGNIHIYATIIKNSVVLIDDGMDKSKLLTTKGIPDINNIKRASFTGPLLTLIAPWYPELTPGDVFHMTPTFFNGHSLMNQFSPEVWRGKDLDDIYRIITMEVNFSTVGTTNEMTITALPVTDQKAKQQVDPVVYTDNLTAAQKAVTNQPVTDNGVVTYVEVGENGEVETHVDISVGTIPAGKDVSVLPGYQIKFIAMDVYRSGVLQVPYTKDLYQKLSRIPGCIITQDHQEVDISQIGWPLIYIATYRAMKAGRGVTKYFVGTLQGKIDLNAAFHHTMTTLPGMKVLAPNIKEGDFKAALAPFKDMKKDIQTLYDSGVNQMDYGTKGEVAILLALMEAS